MGKYEDIREKCNKAMKKCSILGANDREISNKVEAIIKNEFTKVVSRNVPSEDSACDLLKEQLYWGDELNSNEVVVWIENGTKLLDVSIVIKSREHIIIEEKSNKLYTVSYAKKSLGSGFMGESKEAYRDRDMNMVITFMLCSLLKRISCDNIRLVASIVGVRMNTETLNNFKCTLKSRLRNKYI